MKTIDTNLLDTVTGGTGSLPVSSTPTSGGTSDSNSQVLSTLQNIQSSLSDLGKNNNSLFGGQNGALLMMTMAFAFSRNNTTTVVYGGGGGWHHWCHRGW
ncbi:MAG: hypothetical protein JO257_02095 [Deltaproteobacteria bacterium]|nr:hypothetical protein [Deltaproteobacteria bacterium]